MSMSADLYISIDDTKESLINFLNDDKLTVNEIKHQMLILEINLRIDLDWEYEDLIKKLQTEFNDFDFDVYLQYGEEIKDDTERN